MIGNRTNRMPFLITSRYWPNDPVTLQPTLNQSYIEVAQAVNSRIIGIFQPLASVTGETWFEEVPGQMPMERTQTYRKIFRFGAIAAGATLSIPHAIANVQQFTRMYGTCITETPDYRPIPYASATAVDEQIELNGTTTVLNIINGASAPNIESGILVVEFFLN